MKKCPRCGFFHAETDTRCVRCQALLDGLEGLDAERGVETRLARKPWWRLEWPTRLVGVVRRRFYIWGRRLSDGLPEGVHRRNPWVAGGLSLLPGLGQLYNRQPKKGALLLAGMAALVAVAVATIKGPFSNYVLAGWVAASAWAFHDGVMTAKQINRDYLPWQHRVAFYCAWIFYVCAFCTAAQYVGERHVFTLRYIPSEIMAPVFRQGERVVVEKVSYWWREPRVGDVVFYDPPQLRMEMPGALMSEWYFLDPRNAIERVVAGPGQTFERRAGVFYRDGVKVGADEQPLIQDRIYNDFKLTAPMGHYIVLFSYAGGKYYNGIPLPGRLTGMKFDDAPT